MEEMEEVWEMGAKGRKKKKSQGLLLGGSVVKNLPSNASDIV